MLDDKLNELIKSKVSQLHEGDFWHPDPVQDRKLGGPGANQRAREDRASTPKPKEDPRKLRPGESYMDFAKRHGYKPRNESHVPGQPAERLGAVTAIPQSERDAARERLLAKTKAIRDKKKIQEKIDVGADASATISDFVHSKAKTFSGDSKKQRIKRALGAYYAARNEEFEIEEGKQTFPYKKVAAKIKDKLSRSVYAKNDNSPVPNTTDAERKATTQMSKMARVYNQTKRAEQEAAKKRRSPTFYRDTHPTSPPKMRKANESRSFSQFMIAELNRYEKETGKDYKTGKKVTKGGTMGGNDTNSQVMRHMHKVMGAGRMGAGGAIQPRGQKKVPGKKPPAAGQYGGPASPAQKVAKRRASAKASQDFMNDTRGT